jgi:probable HAF family extracellular repeat protein
MMVVRDTVVRALAIAALASAAACSDESAPASPTLPPFDLTPVNPTIDLDGDVTFAFPHDGTKYTYSNVSWTSTNPAVHRSCGVGDIPLHFCANAPGTTTLTFQYVDGRTAIRTLTVRPARIVFQTFDSFVVGHEASVLAYVTNPARRLVSFRSLDTSTAVVGSVAPNVGYTRAGVVSKRAGRFDLEISAIDEPTIRDTVHLIADARRVASIVFPSVQNVTEGRNAYVFGVVIRDQLNGTLYDLAPSVTVVGGDAVARVVSVAPQSGGAVTALVTIAPTAGAAATVRVAIDGVSGDVPVVFRVVARDSAVTTVGAAIVADVAANDFPLGAPPRIVQQPLFGSAAVVANGIRYVPAAGHVGLDSLSYAATSGTRTDTTWVRFVTMPGPFYAEVIATGQVVGADINERGDVVGTITRTDGVRRAFRWMNGRLDTLGFNNLPTEASGIDDQGNVVGWAIVPTTIGATPLPAPILWRPGMQAGEALVDHPLTAAADRPRISRSGIIAVVDWPTIIVIRGAQRDTFECTWCALGGVNDRGDVLYSSTIPTSGVATIRYAAGNRVDVAGAYHIPASGRWIRNDGTALIYQASSVAFGRYGPGIYTPAGVRYLVPAFGDWMGDAYRLNADGWILGTANVAGASLPALFIKDSGALLSKLVAPGVTVTSAFAMNEAGQILASIIDASGAKQLVVYTPTKP